MPSVAPEGLPMAIRGLNLSFAFFGTPVFLNLDS